VETITETVIHYSMLLKYLTPDLLVQQTAIYENRKRTAKEIKLHLHISLSFIVMLKKARHLTKWA